jgi:hypothetical protein
MATISKAFAFEIFSPDGVFFLNARKATAFLGDDVDRTGERLGIEAGSVHLESSVKVAVNSGASLA